MTDEKKTILVVDDTPENIDVLRGILEDDYRVKVALDGTRALKIANAAKQPDLILLDIMMPGLSGYDVCKQLKDNPLTRQIPVIFVTAMGEVEDESKGFTLGAVDYMTKPVNPAIVHARVQTHLMLYDQKLQLEDTVAQRTRELNETRMEIIRRLGRAAEYKDNETGMHVIRMSLYTKILAIAAGLDHEQAELLLNAAPMHDVGKIGIADFILLKPGPLNNEEWAIMRKHPQFGAEIIGDNDSDVLRMAHIVALAHHEKWNGTGYPFGLKGEAIPLAARIVAIADVFDALTTERPYKKAWTVEDAIAILEKDAGSHFDPKLVPLFIKAMPEILAVKASYAETSYE
ncbi:MAG: two-component system response regulator [Mariprofundus sp.]|nr:two-component system response regulator [Mariprofundus sp.]